MHCPRVGGKRWVIHGVQETVALGDKDPATIELNGSTIGKTGSEIARTTTGDRDGRGHQAQRTPPGDGGEDLPTSSGMTSCRCCRAWARWSRGTTGATR